MIRVLVVDDHPVLRAGLEAVRRAEPGFRCVGTAYDSDTLWPLLRRTRPDVVDKGVDVGALFDAIRIAGRRPGPLSSTAAA